MFVVFDLDGTLSDTSHRNHLVRPTNGPKDWKTFHELSILDMPHLMARNVFNELSKNHWVEIWTGRDIAMLDATLSWLARHDFGGFQALNMRAAGDFREDWIIKEEWAQKRMPNLVFEDRTRVVKMWRRIGVPCYQVADGDF